MKYHNEENVRNIQKKSFRLEAGFTLLELLVVIAIIGLLVTAISLNFNKSRDSARNKAMQVEIEELQLALELYKSQYGAYPADIAFLVPDFVDSLPEESDSANSNCSIDYETETDQFWYKYTAERCYAGATSAADGVQPDDALARCLSTCTDCNSDTMDAAYLASDVFYESYAIFSPGGECE